jgi:hypothetical protein
MLRSSSSYPGWRLTAAMTGVASRAGAAPSSETSTRSIVASAPGATMVVSDPKLVGFSLLRTDQSAG